MSAPASTLTRFAANHGESWNQIVQRAAGLCNYAARAEVVRSMTKGEFSPSGQILRGAGVPGANLLSCYVEKVSDDIPAASIAELYASRVRSGAGLGVNLTDWTERQGRLEVDKLLRAIAAELEDLWHNKGIRRTATGITLELESGLLAYLTRRLASEPDLRHLNLIVNVRDETMARLAAGCNDPVTSELIELIWHTGLPCISFIDTVNRLDPFCGELKASNPCGEQYLPPGEGCNLGSINLHAFVDRSGLDTPRLWSAASLLAHLLDRVLEKSSYPSADHRSRALRERRIGLGVMGVASAFSSAGIPYGSNASKQLISETLVVIREATVATLGERRYVTSVAPTGGISSLFGVTPGIEPESPSSGYQHIYDEISLTASAQAVVDNAVSKTVLLPSSAPPLLIRDLLVAAWEQSCKGISFYRDGCRLN
jgi:ribonucleotide reductase alpha subunit